MRLTKEQIIEISQLISKQEKISQNDDEACWMLYGMERILSILKMDKFFSNGATVEITEDQN